MPFVEPAKQESRHAAMQLVSIGQLVDGVRLIDPDPAEGQRPTLYGGTARGLELGDEVFMHEGLVALGRRSGGQVRGVADELMQVAARLAGEARRCAVETPT